MRRPQAAPRGRIAAGAAEGGDLSEAEGRAGSAPARRFKRRTPRCDHEPEARARTQARASSAHPGTESGEGLGLVDEPAAPKGLPRSP